MSNICKLCDSNLIEKCFSFNFFFKKKHTQYYCNKCSLIFLKIKKKKIYSNSTYRALGNDPTLKLLDPWQKISFLRGKRIVQDIFKIKKNIRSWLDIGGYTGIMLKNKMLSNIDTTIAEMDPEAIKVANLYGHKTINLNNQKILKKYDVISFVQVLEHLDNPLEVLKKIKNNLNKNSILYIEVPNIINFPNSDNSHVNEFCEASLKNLFSLSGYSIIKFGYTKTDDYSKQLDWFYAKKKENIFAILKKGGNYVNKKNLQKHNKYIFFLKILMGQNLLHWTFLKNNLAKMFGFGNRFMKGLIFFLIGLLLILIKLPFIILPSKIKKI